MEKKNCVYDQGENPTLMIVPYETERKKKVNSSRGGEEKCNNGFMQLPNANGFLYRIEKNERKKWNDLETH